MTLARRSLLVLPLATTAASVVAQSVWYAVRGADRSFIVDMPGEPVYKLIDATSPAGTHFVIHSYSLDLGGHSFVAQTALYPVDAGVSLQAILDDRAQRLDGRKWTRIDWRTIQGVPAVESVGAVQGGLMLRQLVLLRGTRYVSLACLAPAAALNTPQVERFFGSLRLVQ